MTKRPNFYAMLGLLRSATQNEIRQAYLRAAKRLHPDTNNAPGETELFLDVQQAYQVLSDSSRRSAYDATLPKEEEIPSVVNQNIQISRKELAQIKEPQLIYVLIDLSPSEEVKKTASSVPLNICMVLDCSTSMNGEKLDTVKNTAIQLIRKLKPQDIFSMVSFSDRAEVIIPATRQANTHKMENKVQILQTNGGTEILHGLRAGLEEVRRYASPNYINHVILLTDGRTYGDEQDCYELARNAAEANIGISGMGIGSGWNDIFLDQLATFTGGEAMFVSQPNDIERLLTVKFANLSQTFAENVELEFEIGEGVDVNYVFRLQPDTTPVVAEKPLRLGPILQDFPLSVLIELKVHPQPKETKQVNLLDGKLHITSAALQMTVVPIPVNFTLEIEEHHTPEPPPTAIIQALSKLTLYRIQEKARAEVKSGNYDQATKHLQRLATHLLAQGERNLAKTIMLEVEHIEKEKTFSEGGEKQIKYGTRALLLPGE